MIKNNFISEIEELIKNKNISYMDAILLWCEIKFIDIEEVASWIKKDPFIKSQLQLEAENLRFLKKE